MISKFKKRFIEVEAMQLTHNAYDEVRKWLAGYIIRMDAEYDCNGLQSIMIYLGNSNLNINIGDWIIKDANNDITSCNSIMFEKLYESI